MMPSVFLSHSCKDREQDPPADVAEADRQARAERLTVARTFRDMLYTSLATLERYEIWLDVRGGLRPGDVWRDGIHQALKRCSAAVILLSPEALDSGWVLKETTILTWRRLLGEELLVVPVRLGVSDDDLRTCGFEPSGVLSIQAEVVRDDAAELGVAVERVVERITDFLPAEIRPRTTTWSSTVQRWLVETAKLLHEQDPRYMTDMFRVLGLDPTDDDRLGEPSLAVANELLVADRDDILDVLDTLSGVRTAAQKEMLRRAVDMLWVSARAASTIPEVAARRQEPRVIAIDGDAQITGQDYVDRAYCGRLRFGRVLAPDDSGDGTREQGLARIETLLLDWVPIEDPEELARDVRRNGPFYVVLGPTDSRAGVVTELAARYPALTVIALTGKDGSAAAALPEHTVHLVPRLGAGEKAGQRYRTRLKEFV